MLKPPFAAVLTALLLAPALSGCVWVAATGLFAAATASRQERTVGAAIDDVRMKSTITNRLAELSSTNFLNVSTTVVEGRVLLTGRLANPQMRLDATRAAWGVDGVRKVDNEIEVTDRAGLIDRPRDIFIRAEIAADLLTDSSIKDVNYTVDVVNGVVYIVGIGQDQAEVDRVIARAERFQGVVRVENYVVLKDDPGRFFAAPAGERPRS